MMVYVCKFQNSMLYKINMHYLPSKKFKLKDYNTTLTFVAWFWFFSRNWFVNFFQIYWLQIILQMLLWSFLFIFVGSVVVSHFKSLKLSVFLCWSVYSGNTEPSCCFFPVASQANPGRPLLLDTVPKPTSPEWCVVCPCKHLTLSEPMSHSEQCSICSSWSYLWAIGQVSV